MNFSKSMALSKPKSGKGNDFIRKYGALCALALLILVNILITPNFAKLNTFINLGTQSFTVILAGIGMSLVIGAGGIDISVGSTMAVASVVCCLLLETLGVVPAILVSLVVAFSIGFFNGFMITAFKIQPIIVTLVLYISGRGIAQVLNDGQTITFYDNGFTDIGLFRIGGIPIQIFVAIVFIIIFMFITKKTVFGFNTQAIGENPRAARLNGINTKYVTIAAYVIIALACRCLRQYSIHRGLGSADPNTIGKQVEIDAIAAVAVGGTPLSGGKINMAGTIFRRDTYAVDYRNHQYE